MNHLRPDGGLPGIPYFTKKKLLELPLDSELLFAGQFDQVLKDTTSTQAVAFQASQIAASSPHLDLSGFKIPKRPAQSKGQGPAKKRRRGRSPVQPQQQQQQQQQVAQPQAQEKPQQQRSGYNSSGSRGRGRGRAGPGPNEVEPGPVGGRLWEFVGAWGDITSDKWVLQTVSSGYRIEFTESCRLTRAPLWTIVPAKHKHRVALEEGLHKMLLKKAIVQLDPSMIGPGFYSSLFLVEKRSGGWRPILNLKRLNEGVKPPKFRMDTLQSVLNTLGADIKLYWDGCPPGAEVSGPWALSLDLQDAYFHVPVDPRDTKYLRFAYDGEIFEFQVLPFGLLTAPRTFTRLVRAVGAYLKTLGINVFQYLDDWLVVGETYQLALSYRDTVRWVTQRVGFVLNEEKSDWVPSQFPLFLGSSLDLVRLLAFPSEDRIDRLQRLIPRVLKSPASLWRSLLATWPA